MTTYLIPLILIGGLTSAGVYLLLERSLTRMLLGLLLIGNAINLLILTVGGPSGNPPIRGRTSNGETTTADPLAQGMILTAIEVDARRAARLAKRTSASTRVVDADFLQYRLPRAPHVIVGNLPFHLTTAMLRRILHGPGWTDAVLLVQWEVARRRAAVGGATMMTAQWWPWFEFALVRRVSASSFRPMPSVDGGLITIRRRAEPLVDARDRRRYQAMVHQVFTGRGHGIAQILARGPGRLNTRQWLRDNDVRASALPRDLSAAQWADLFASSRRLD